MKKLLMLLMAFLLFAPPRAKAEDKTATIYSNKWRTYSATNPQIQYKNAVTSAWTAYSPVANSSVYPMLIRSNVVEGVQMLMTTTASSSYNMTLKGYTIGTAVSGTDRYTNDYQRYIQLYKNAHVKFGGYFAKIKQVKITHNLNGLNGSMLYYVDDAGLGKTFGTKAIVASGPVQGSATSSYTVTIDNPTSKNELEIWYTGANLNMFEIEVTYEETDPTPVENPTVKYNEAYGIQKVKIDGEDVYELPIDYHSQNLFSFILSGHADGLYYTFSEDIATIDNSNKASAMTWASQTNLNNATTQWSALSSGVGVKFDGLSCTDATLDDAKVFTIRAKAYSSVTDEWSDEVRVKAKFVRLPAPELDLEAMEANNKTASGFYYKDDELHYTGYNPSLYFKNPKGITATSTYIKLVYKTDYTSVTAGQTTPALAFGAGTNGLTGPISISNGNADERPAKGASQTVYAATIVNNYLHTSTNNQYTGNQYWWGGESNKIVKIKVISDNPAGEEEAPIQKIAKPAINLSESAKTATLSGGVYGYISSNILVNVNSGYDYDDYGTGTLKYQYFDASNGSWVSTPSNDEDAWKDAPDGGIKVTGTGRLFVREEREGYEASDYSFADFRKLETTKVNTLDREALLNLPSTAEAITIDMPVRLIGSFNYTENAGIDGKNVYLMFFADKDGNVIRVHNEDTGANPWPYDADNKYMMFKNLTGELIKNKEMPELYLNNSTLDYSVFLDGPYKAADLIANKDLEENYPMYEPTTSETVPVADDYSKLMYFGPLRWDAKENVFFDNQEGRVELYSRIETEIDKIYNGAEFDNGVAGLEASLINGVQYRVAGYVGYANGAYVIMPRAIVAAPRLLAPNAINPDAAPNELIDMNVISDQLTITVNPEGLSTRGELFYTTTTDVTKWLNEQTQKFDPAMIDWTGVEGVALDSNGEIGNNQIPVSDILNEDTPSALAVKLNRDGFESSVVAVKFIKHAAEPVATIGDFKGKDFDVANLPLITATDKDDDYEYYRFDGLARVREVTPHYLYIRTINDDGSLLDGADENNLSDEQKANRSANSILLYNKDGWENVEVAGVKLKASASTQDADDENSRFEPGEEAARSLQAGDVITNFALIPNKSQFGNLIGQTTNFARTFRRVENVEVKGSTDPLVKNAQDAENVTPFDESDRMLRYKIEQAQVIKVKDENGLPKKDDNGNFTYYIDMPGKPVLNVRDVFEPVVGWDETQDDNAYYDLTGVVMLADGGADVKADGRYMLALIDFDQPGVTPAEDPFVVLEGVGVNNDDLTFLTTANVRLRSGDTQGEDSDLYTVYYTTDGTDPETSNTAEAYVSGEPIEVSANTTIKAFVVAQGHPNSNVVEFNLTRLASDRRYIVDFVNNSVAETPYRLVTTARVVAKGNEYAVIRGAQGNYLPLHFDGDAIAKMPEVGDYLGSFVAKPHMVNVDGTNIVRGAHVESEYAGLFTGKVEKPASLGDDDITAEPELVATITPAHARRYVRINNVALKGEAFNEDDIDNHANTSWTCVTNKDKGEEIAINNSILPVSNFDWDDDDKKDAACYNIIGYVMLNEKTGTVELWPTDVELVKTAPAVKVSYRADGGSLQTPATTPNKTYDVDFNTYATVTLSCDAIGSTIYYYISPDDETAIPANAKWNVYGQPFNVTANRYIHAYAVADGFEVVTDDHTHIFMNKKDALDDIVISTDPNEAAGTTTVTLAPKAGKQGTIFYSFDNFATEGTAYTEPIVVNETKILYVRLGQTGKVQHLLISVPAQVVADPDVAGNVEISVNGAEVTVTRAAGATGTIYYSFDNFQTAPQEYTAPVTMTKTGIFYARLVDGAKLPGAISHALVIVADGEGQTPTDPTKPGTSDKVSGKVKVNIDNESDVNKVIVTIVPAGNVDGEYAIYYSINADEHLTPENGILYTTPIELTEGSRVMAILVEKGKAAGELADIFVTVTPAEIDGIDADRAEEAVSVSGNDIVAPEGSMVFDLMGRRVNATSLRTGIYIVRTPAGKAVKVRID